MLLNDTVGYREAKAGALLGALGGKEWIVDAMQVLRRDPVAGIGNLHPRTQPVGPRAHFQGAARAHGVARVQEQVEEHLLQFPGIAVHQRDRKSTRLNSSHLGISYAV